MIGIKPSSWRMQFHRHLRAQASANPFAMFRGGLALLTFINRRLSLAAEEANGKAISISWGQGHFIREKDLWLMVLPWLCSYKTGFLQTDLAAVPTGLPGCSFYHSVSCLIWVQNTLQITQVSSALRPRSKSNDLEEAWSLMPTSSRLLGHSDEGTRTTANHEFHV